MNKITSLQGLASSLTYYYDFIACQNHSFFFFFFCELGFYGKKNNFYMTPQK